MWYSVLIHPTKGRFLDCTDICSHFYNICKRTFFFRWLWHDQSKMWNGYFSRDCSLGISNLFYSIDWHGLYLRFLNLCLIFSFSIEISEKVRGGKPWKLSKCFWPHVNIFVVAYLFSWIYLLYCTFTILRVLSLNDIDVPLVMIGRCLFVCSLHFLQYIYSVTKSILLD